MQKGKQSNLKNISFWNVMLLCRLL